MQCLRHPIRSITEPFGKAGLTVAILALVLATTGAAFAAGKLTAGQKKEVKAIAKQFAGKPGAAGERGPQGEKGAAGAAGTNGTSGTNGADGKSVVFLNEEPENCENEEGLTYEVAGSGSKNEVCRGPEGSPWTAGGTLPSEKTETGVWSLSAPSVVETVNLNVTKEVVEGKEVVTEVSPETTEAEPSLGIPLSFDIPLAAPLVAAKVHYVTKAEVTGHTAPAACPGNVEQPKAEPGNLCVYESFSLHVASGGTQVRNPTVFPPSPGAARSGVEIVMNTEAGPPHIALGSWAVTAP